ncbi:MAG: lytic transglycosylase [Acidiphilium sp. 37-64-53]|nr:MULTISPECIES: lytic transglycosylase domain-containing protein [unclassified Acidiphilium]OYW03050.1 MAG: lytic transglycosylase [Acidiphilium sp. 37-64-53]HQT84359.1 lytic transglycosylase domain-containing protein [Acidiphilium rubrum]
MAIPYLACMALVASIYHLPPRVLPSIAVVEGGINGSINHNVNGSDDLGVMQVNTIWLPALSRYTGLPASLVKTRLTTRPCFNIAAAGAILRTYLAQDDEHLMQAVGDYHSHTAPLNHAYQIKVLNAARALFASGRSTAPR